MTPMGQEKQSSYTQQCFCIILAYCLPFLTKDIINHDDDDQQLFLQNLLYQTVQKVTKAIMCNDKISATS